MPDGVITNSRRITQLEGLRAYAVLRVFFDHALGFREVWSRRSYTIYLVHVMVLTVVRKHLHVHRYSVGTAIALAIALIYAAFSWRLLERPLLLGGEAKHAIEPRNRAQP
jgi:peptidoglycan/LPS O-acetylase OafA/YrhL